MSRGRDTQPPGPREKLSVVVITLNEQDRLARCLDSLRRADEIVIVDSGSTDGTREVARRYTHLVVQEAFKDFASQKNYGVSLASHEWVLSIDADEVVTPELEAEIEEVLSGQRGEEMFSVPRQNVYFGRSLRHVLGRDEPVRLFMRSRARFEGPVHEKVVGGRLGRLRSPLMHFSCRTYGEWRQKHRRYVRLDAARQFELGRRFSLVRCLFSPLRTLFYRAVVLGGWRDGWAGLAVAGEMAFSMILFQMELLRLSRARDGGRP